MAFDFIDMLVDTKDEYLTGHFYKRRPRTPEDGKIVFKYKQLDPNSKIFDTVLGNVRADSARYAIETNDHCGFNIGGYIITQNGLIWEITEVITNEQADGSNNALRWFTTAKNAKCSVRMIRIADLFDKEEAYSKYCEVSINVEVPNCWETCSCLVNDNETVNMSSPSPRMRSGKFFVEKGVSAKVYITVSISGPGIEPSLKEKTLYLSSLQTVGDSYLLEYDSTTED